MRWEVRKEHGLGISAYSLLSFCRAPRVSEAQATLEQSRMQDHLWLVAVEASRIQILKEHLVLACPRQPRSSLQLT